MKQLDGKWALVTGSSRGIGQQIAVGLAEHGANIIVHGRDLAHTQKTVSLARDKGVQVLAVAGELDSDAGVKHIIESGCETGKPVDILYNNAAIQNRFMPIWEIPMDDWRHSFQVNVFSIVALCNGFAPAMRERGWGRIINLTSGIRDIPQLAPYSVSKAAVDKYSRDLAAELKGSGVLVNYLDPGWLRTDLGGPNGMFPVEAVLPGALVPALLPDDGPTGQFYAAQDYRKD
jgi:NAD(P)-dependent dehydrogenase (short-subunit alcohol dehydrogenase family)